jgi:hypothetical protein
MESVETWRVSMGMTVGSFSRIWRLDGRAEIVMDEISQDTDIVES